jgi:four helix bundle protein
MAFKFENLIVWQKAVDLSADISELTKTFPKEELYVLTAQAQKGLRFNIIEYCRGFNRTDYTRV